MILSSIHSLVVSLYYIIYSIIEKDTANRKYIQADKTKTINQLAVHQAHQAL